MKILVIHSYYYPDIKGGAEYSIKKLAEGLVNRGHDVSVLCDNPEKNQDDNINGVHVYRRTMKCIRKSSNPVSKVARALLELNNPLNYKIIQNVVKNVNPEVIYTNCLEHISPIAWKVASDMNIKIVDTQRVYILLEMAGGKYAYGNRLWLSSNKKMSKLVNKCAFISHATQRRFESEGFFENATHQVIYNSIDFNTEEVQEKVNQRIENKPANGVFKYVYLGTISEHKGIIVLLNAFEKMRDYPMELHIAGDGKLKNLIEERAKQNEKIIYHGWLKESAVNELLSKCDALVCPSIWSEPFGRVVLDAYKQGMPVVAAASGGLAETVVDGETGLLVKPNDVEVQFQAMKRLAMDRELYRHCCSNLPDKIKEFSLEHYLDCFEEIFDRRN